MNSLVSFLVALMFILGFVYVFLAVATDDVWFMFAALAGIFTFGVFIVWAY